MAFFFQVRAQLSLKNAPLPPNFFLDSVSSCLDLLFPKIINRAKILLY